MPVGTVVARNLMDGVTVLSSDNKGTHTVEWGAYGDPDGNDVQYIPTEIADSVPFRRALSRGVIELVGDETDKDVAESLLRQVDAFKRRQAGAVEQAESLIERPANNDSIMLFCVGPDSRGNAGKCQQPVPVKATQKDAVPPLCTMHRLLAPQFVSTVVIDNGESKTQWTQVSLGSREKNL